MSRRGEPDLDDVKTSWGMQGLCRTLKDEWSMRGHWWGQSERKGSKGSCVPHTTHTVNVHSVPALSQRVFLVLNTEMINRDMNLDLMEPALCSGSKDVSRLPWAIPHGYLSKYIYHTKDSYPYPDGQAKGARAWRLIKNAPRWVAGKKKIEIEQHEQWFPCQPSNTIGTLPSQGLCTCSSFYQGHSLSRSFISSPSGLSSNVSLFWPPD